MYMCMFMYKYIEHRNRKSSFLGEFLIYIFHQVSADSEHAFRALLHSLELFCLKGIFLSRVIEYSERHDVMTLVNDVKAMFCSPGYCSLNGECFNNTCICRDGTL